MVNLMGLKTTHCILNVYGKSDRTIDTLQTSSDVKTGSTETPRARCKEHSGEEPAGDSGSSIMEPVQTQVEVWLLPAVLYWALYTNVAVDL